MDEGDSLTGSVSHNIQINGADSWVRFESSTKVRKGETADQAFQRLDSFLQDKVIQLCQNSAQAIIDFEKENN